MPMSREPMEWLDMSSKAISMLPPRCDMPVSLPYAECTATAFASLSAQLHAFFDLSEFTRAGGWDARERTSMLGPGARV